MPIGFQSFTTSGVVQLDSQVKHLVYKTKGTLTSFTTLVASVSKTCTVSYTGTAPVICILEDTGILLRTTKSGSNYTFTIVTKTAVSSVTYYIYDVISGSPTGNFGLQLFTSSGELSFDSNQRPLIPTQLLSVSGEVSTTVTSGRTYAISYSKFPITGTEGVPQPPEGEFSLYKRTTFFPIRSSSTSLLLEFWKWRGNSATSLGETAAGGESIARATIPVTASIIDVTGL
jgi:hypothetical protein